MEVRDAVEADADALSDLAEAPADVMRGVVHDRTVRVVEAVADTDEPDETTSDEPQAEAGTVTDGADVEERTGASVTGFVSFDARSETVYVTHGNNDSFARWLNEEKNLDARELPLRSQYDD